MNEQPHNPIEPHEQEEAEKKDAEASRARRDQEVSDLKWLMGHEEGRRIAWRLLEGAGVFRSSFSMNGLQMAFSEGNRNQGVKLLAEIHEHCPVRYTQMVKEQKEHGNARSKR